MSANTRDKRFEKWMLGKECLRADFGFVDLLIFFSGSFFHLPTFYCYLEWNCWSIRGLLVLAISFILALEFLPGVKLLVYHRVIVIDLHVFFAVTQGGSNIEKMSAGLFRITETILWITLQVLKRFFFAFFSGVVPGSFRPKIDFTNYGRLLMANVKVVEGWISCSKRDLGDWEEERRLILFDQTSILRRKGRKMINHEMILDLWYFVGK